MDYVLVDYGNVLISDVSDSDELILLYEKPENYDNKETVVAYADGHAEFVKIEDFKRQLRETKAWIKNRNKQLPSKRHRNRKHRKHGRFSSPPEPTNK